MELVLKKRKESKGDYSFARMHLDKEVTMLIVSEGLIWFSFLISQMIGKLESYISTLCAIFDCAVYMCSKGKCKAISHVQKGRFN